LGEYVLSDVFGYRTGILWEYGKKNRGRKKRDILHLDPGKNAGKKKESHSPPKEQTPML